MKQSHLYTFIIKYNSLIFGVYKHTVSRARSVVLIKEENISDEKFIFEYKKKYPNSKLRSLTLKGKFVLSNEYKYYIETTCKEDIRNSKLKQIITYAEERENI